MTPRLLDLYCGAGGSSMGFHQAGFDVTGVDIEPQPHYPFRFWHMDALDIDVWVLAAFDAVHAAPPCQAHSPLRHRTGKQYPDLIGATRDLLLAGGRPWVMENVPGSPLVGTYMLCGSAFDLGATCRDGRYRQLRRHRYFELSFPMPSLQPGCRHFGQALGVYGDGGTCNNDGQQERGGYKGTAKEKYAAMGIDWMNSTELSQAMPPAYTHWLGHLLLDEVDR